MLCGAGHPNHQMMIRKLNYRLLNLLVTTQMMIILHCTGSTLDHTREVLYEPNHTLA